MLLHRVATWNEMTKADACGSQWSLFHFEFWIRYSMQNFYLHFWLRTHSVRSFVNPKFMFHQWLVLNLKIQRKVDFICFMDKKRHETNCFVFHLFSSHFSLFFSFSLSSSVHCDAAFAGVYLLFQKSVFVSFLFCRRRLVVCMSDGAHRCAVGCKKRCLNSTTGWRRRLLVIVTLVGCVYAHIFYLITHAVDDKDFIRFWASKNRQKFSTCVGVTQCEWTRRKAENEKKSCAGGNWWHRKTTKNGLWQYQQRTTRHATQINDIDGPKCQLTHFVNFALGFFFLMTEKTHLT